PWNLRGTLSRGARSPRLPAPPGGAYREDTSMRRCALGTLVAGPGKAGRARVVTVVPPAPTASAAVGAARLTAAAHTASRGGAAPHGPPVRRPHTPAGGAEARVA